MCVCACVHANGWVGGGGEEEGGEWWGGEGMGVAGSQTLLRLVTRDEQHFRLGQRLSVHRCPKRVLEK